MERTVLLDLLSEILTVEQGGLERYRVAAARCTDAALAQRYAAFGEEMARRRGLLVRLIERLGGDPAYVGPTARLAQARAGALEGVLLAHTTLAAGGPSQPELEAAALEGVLLAETKAQAAWRLLQRLAAQADDPAVRAALEELVPQVEAEEDGHLPWVGDALAEGTPRREPQWAYPPALREQQATAPPS